MDYNEYKVPKRNYRYRILIWGLLILNIATFIWNTLTGSWVVLIAIVGIAFSIYNLYMHHVKGIDLWN